MAEKLLLISRYGEEKISKMFLMTEIHLMTKKETVAKLNELRRRTKREVRLFEEEAKREYKAKVGGLDSRGRRLVWSRLQALGV